MALKIVENVPHFDFVVGGSKPEDLRVLRFQGTEGISELYRYEIELASKDPEIEFPSIVGRDATLTWRDREGDHWIHGIIARFEQGGRGQDFTSYRARLVPKVWTLTLRYQSRIFQNVSVPDILKQVLDTAGVPSDLYRFEISGSFKPREYCVQYRESDWNFLSRLAEEEGIFHFFEQTEESHVLVMGNTPSVHGTIDGQSTLPFSEPGFGTAEREHVTRFRNVQQIRHGAVTLRDYDFKKPSLSLQANKVADLETDLEFYDYPGEYVDLVAGKTYADVRLQELRAEREVASGEGNCTRLLPGCKFTLEEHPRGDLNQEYVITRVQHWGNQPQSAEADAAPLGETVYHNSFECIPATVPYRPRRWTPRPRIEGPQTAIVVGPAGEEIHTDEHGRVKVQFHWDRAGKKDEKSSCWIRVSQGWAGAGWGMVIIPRIGHEVVVDFLEGDPDQPIIIGRVYNGENPPPYALPEGKTISSFKSNTSPGGGGMNEIRFEDSAGVEEIFIHGQKDENIVIENDKTQSIGHDETRSVGNDESVTIGHDETWHVKNDRNKNVDNNQTETIGVDKTISVGSNHTESIGSNMTITVGSNLTETIAINYAETVGAAMELTIGGMMAETVGVTKTETIGTSKTETIGTSKTETIGTTKAEKVGTSKSETIGTDKNLEVKANLNEKIGAKNLREVKDAFGLTAKTITMEAKDQITIKTGSAIIQMNKNGDITIEGKNINVKGSGNIVMKASKIQQN